MRTDHRKDEQLQWPGRRRKETRGKTLKEKKSSRRGTAMSRQGKKREKLSFQKGKPQK